MENIRTQVITDLFIRDKKKFIVEIKKRLINDEIILLGMITDLVPIIQACYNPDSANNIDLSVVKTHEPPIFFAKKSLAFFTFLQDEYALSTSDVKEMQVMWFLEGKANFNSGITAEDAYQLMLQWASVTKGMKNWGDRPKK